VKVDRRIRWHYTTTIYFAFALVHDSRGIETVDFTTAAALSAGTLMASASTPYRLVPAHFYPCLPLSILSLPYADPAHYVGRCQASYFGSGASGVTSHRQPRQCRVPRTVKGAQSHPNYVSRLLARSECLPGGAKIIVTPLSGALLAPLKSARAPSLLSARFIPIFFLKGTTRGDICCRWVH